ncbi:uncharacterized protein LOC105393079 [Plutella xylostella]|uniref:uncharacterized protein LOC105393079 n=1 Tax=Plutella xylostella TaxID=51655 RepID=UPI002032B8D4|nr:uncharacterized protein LOC105393079 [Plutella xylostella]
MRCLFCRPIMVSQERDAYTDVVELCALLQCLGFNVKSLDTNEGTNVSQDAGVVGGTRTVVINCQSSGLHVVLESGAAACSCPATDHQNSGFWQMEAVTGGKQVEKECGSALLGSLPKSFKERLSADLQEMVRCIKQHTGDADAPAPHHSASLAELTTPEKKITMQQLKADTPTRYRSLDTLSGGQGAELPPPGSLTKPPPEADRASKVPLMCRRQSTYTVASTPGGSVRKRNKTSSPIQPQSSVLDSLIEAEKAAEALRYQLASIIRDFADEGRDDSSMSSLALDVSKISLLKGADSKAQFASSPNLSGMGTLHEGLTKGNLKRFESASTSNLLSAKSTPKESTSRISKLRRLSPSIFKMRKDSSSAAKGDKSAKSDTSKTSKFNNMMRPRIVTPVRIPRQVSEASPNLSASKNKFSHIKSTIPRPASAKKE